MSPPETKAAVDRVRKFGKENSDRTLYVIRQRKNLKLCLAGKFIEKRWHTTTSVAWSTAAATARYQPRMFSLPADAALYFFDLRDPPYNPERYEMEEHLVLPDGTIDLVGKSTFIRSLDIPPREPEVKNHVHITFDPRANRGESRPAEEVPAERALPGVPDGGDRVAPEAGTPQG